jgi:acetyl/propionyl-CoA carboxylase alpha subunit
MKQEDLKIVGHAIELRVYAEDPLNNFLPSVGTLDTYKLPVGEGVRVDNGFEEGMDVPIYYDPMLSKLVTYGKTREEAIQRIIKAIDSYRIEGVQTTLPFGKYVFEHEAFRSGNFDTHFVKDFYSPEILKQRAYEEAEIAALVALKQYLADQKILRTPIN